MAAVLVADQLTKRLVQSNIEQGEHNNVFFGIDLVHVRNHGVAFGAFAGGELAGYLEARAATVVSLVTEAAQAAAAEKAGFAFIDLSGAVKGYATGRPHGGPAAGIPDPGVGFGQEVRNYFGQVRTT